MDKSSLPGYMAEYNDTEDRNSQPSRPRRVATIFAIQSLFIFIAINALHWFRRSYNDATKMADAPWWQVALAISMANLCAHLLLHKMGYGGLFS